MNENDRQVKAWQFTKLLLARTDFQNDVENFRKEWQEPKGGFSDNKSRREWERKRDRELALVFTRTHKYGLYATSLQPLLIYITTGKTQFPFIGVLPKVTIRVDENSRNPEYLLRFYEHTTEAEIRHAFNTYKSVHIKDKRQHSIADTKLKKMIRANELRQSGLKWKEVATILSNEFNDNLIQYNDARKLVEQYKKLTNQK